MYSLTEEAAVHNSEILKKYNYDLTRTIAAHPNTEIAYGSEFRPASVLKPILHQHIHWNYIESSLNHGVKTKFSKIKKNNG